MDATARISLCLNSVVYSFRVNHMQHDCIREKREYWGGIPFDNFFKMQNMIWRIRGDHCILLNLGQSRPVHPSCSLLGSFPYIMLGRPTCSCTLSLTSSTSKQKCCQENKGRKRTETFPYFWGSKRNWQKIKLGLNLTNVEKRCDSTQKKHSFDITVIAPSVIALLSWRWIGKL